MAQNYINVDEVIRSLLIQEGDETTHRYFYYKDIALRGVKELNFDVVRNIQYAKVTVSSTLSVALPSDFVAVSRIGVSKHGQIDDLGKNDKMDLTADQSAVSNPVTAYAVQWIDDLSGSENLGGMYGLGGGQNVNGYWRFDAENNTIQLASGFSGAEVVLEYISDGISRTGKQITQIHVYAEEALRTYMHWKSIQRKRTIPANMKEQARRDWYNEKRIAKARMKSFTKAEAIQQAHRHTYQAPKY